MAPTSKGNTVRVGVLITVALAVLMVSLFFIGSESKVWARKNEYDVRFESVAGLAEGNPVKISGVTVGVVRDIQLPRDPKKRAVEISLMVDRKYAERIRGDSRARLKKLGLLAGDSYIDITPGDPRFPTVEPGSVIPAQRETNVDALISSGEDLVDNFVQISYSLKNILGRVDRGEGLIGELTTSPETKQRLTDTFLLTLNKTNAALAHMESGRGVAGKLIYDDKFADQLTSSLIGSAQSLQTVATNIQKGLETGNGLLPALIHDPEGKKKVYDLVDNLRTTSANLATFSTSLQTGQGLVPRLINDKAYGDQALNEFSGLVHQLNDTVAKLNSGQGTAGKMLTDPSVYESINDILIGINESKLLRWLIRNRQQSGIQQRYNEEQKTAPPPPVGGDSGTQPQSSTAPPPVTTTATTTTTTTSTAPPPY
ncbi:MAG TPA: MlaD family protein [Thermoanaerobaculia bacterium]|jgi:phospholipid/cholesterol/gamma-HCH transport system substrate-binding protein|nr:MlaD family protein [Thermoanaerobaculia bacterium]